MLFVSIGLIIAYLLLVVFMNGYRGSAPVVDLRIVRIPNSPSVQKNSPITLVSWNLGYAGLGASSNFVADGGTDYLPPSKQNVVSNVEGITGTIGELEADIFLFQELASASLINRQTDLRGPVQRSLPGTTSVFSPDVQTYLLPPPLNMEIGNGVFSDFEIETAQGRLLPLEKPMLGLIRKNYRMLVCYLPIIGTRAKLVLVNVHLAAFDDAAQVRTSQLRQVSSFLEQAYRDGNYVICGGDWNLRLTETNFPHQTEEKYLFWLADVPAGVFPENWTIAADERVPSVRTDHKAYVEGENYTCVIDGFVLSPNVKLLDVQNIDLGFRHSDHQPAMLRVTLE